MKIGFVLGTRPEIIKLASSIKYCDDANIEYFVVHTNQHYSENMDGVFFKDLELPIPKYNLNINKCSHAVMTGNMMIKLEEVFLDEKPDIVFVQGDTNSVLSGALTAAKMGIKVGHIEAGLRSYDRRMPEELNRVVVDHLSDYLFVPTENQKKTLMSENIDESKIFVTGNTIVDALQHSTLLAEKKYSDKYAGKEFILATFHRSENVDVEDNLKGIILGLDKVATEFQMEIIVPLHPRTKSKLTLFGIEVPSSIKIIEPVGYLEFIMLQKEAKLILTDSGGIQEESCILATPCVTLRENTERPETIEVGANLLAGTNPDTILDAAKKMFVAKTDWRNPFGDGTSGKKIITIAINM